MKYNYNQLDQLFNEVGTPCYLVNEDLFLTNIRNIRNAFVSKYPKTIVGYSFKTNYLPYICNLAKSEGCYAEVVSYLEYQIAKKVGFAPSNIIFNSPVKRKGEFFDALHSGALINIDSEYEVLYLEEYHKQNPEKDIKVGVRVNVAIKDENGNSAIYGDEKIGRFGFIESEFKDIFARLSKINCSIVSLHGHTSSKNRAISNYLQISDELLHIRQEYDLDPDYIDIGGGFFGPVPKGMFSQEPPKYLDYADAIVEHLLQNDWFRNKKPYLIIEPGMSVAASSMTYVTRVYNIKERENRIVAQVDGNMFQIRQNLYQFKLPYYIVSKDSIMHKTDEQRIDFTGSTCMESDIMVRKNGFLDFSVGDYLLIDNVGAYTFVMGSNFIQFLPHIAVLKNNHFEVVREGNNFNNFIEIYHW